MLNSKQRAVLRGMASTAQTLGQIGKSGINETTANEVSLALQARELVKYRVLETCELTSREVAETLAAKTDSEVVAVIGSKFILYRANPDKPVIKL